MVRRVIDIGVVGNDGTGDSIRDSFRKVNDNFRELYGALGLGERLSFIDLDETPDSYAGKANHILSVNDAPDGVVFKELVGGTGINIDPTGPNQILITNTQASVSADSNPILGGDLQAAGGGRQWRIQQLTTPVTSDEAVNKQYADSKISLAGVSGIDPQTGSANSSFGTMTGPLILSRDPRPEDDITYGGLVAATKNYVDNAGFGSIINLYVATSGDDARVGVGSSVQGTALAYAYRSIEAALKRAEEIIKSSRPEIGPYKKVLTWTNPATGAVNDCTLSYIETSEDSGTGFLGRVTLTIDTIRLRDGGNYFQVGEIIKINATGGDAENAATLEILTIDSEPGSTQGPIRTFRLLTGGVFDEGSDGSGPGLPTEDITGGVTVGGAESGSQFGSGAIFEITYKVSTAIIENGGGSARGPEYVDYGLVSVRVTDGGGSGAFGFADVTGGSISAITITDGGSGFNSFPNLIVELPRFGIYTGGERTDFTGDTLTDSAEATRSRDIREGLFLEGTESGALAQILAHGSTLGAFGLDSEGNELFDVDIIYGTFIPGETIAYGDTANSRQICVFIEAGVYYENLPLRIPQNVAVIGDEFRRTVIRPKPGFSTSPWAFQYFRRDRTVDGISTANSENGRNYEDPFGYHYLDDPSQPVYPLVNNRGFYRAASALLSLNKSFLQEEVIAWVNKQIAEEILPFVDFEYNQDLCKRDVGLIIESMAYDLLYGGSARTISAALKYRTNASGLLAITPNSSGGQLEQTTLAIRRLETAIQLVIRNIEVIPSSYIDPLTDVLIDYAEPQIIDTAYQVESGAGGTTLQVEAVVRGTTTTITTSSAHLLSNGEIVTFLGMLDVDDEPINELNRNSFWVTVVNSTQFQLFVNQERTLAYNSNSLAEYQPDSGDVIPNGGVVGALTDAIINVFEDSGAVNYPLDNDKMDVFLCNDAVILRAVTIQGCGGFAMVLDPEGQILAKSPYAQEAAVFSRSTGRHIFAGGMFIDGFAGNIKFKITGIVNPTRLTITGLQRFPQLPASYIVDDQVYRINYVRDYVFNPAGSTATFVLDETTPWNFSLFTYNQDICRRDVGLILGGLGYDLVLGTNYHQRKAGLSYRLANAAVVIESQQSLTLRAITEAHSGAIAVLQSFEPAITYGVQIAGISSSNNTINNIIRRGITAAPNLSFTDPPGIASALSNAKNLLVSNLNFIKEVVLAYMTYTYTTADFTPSRFQRDIQYTTEALIYDILYGGNGQTRDQVYYFQNGVGDALASQVPTGLESEYSGGLDFLRTTAKDIIQNNTIASTFLVSAGDFIIGRQYVINTVGTTNFTAIGASSNTPGLVFAASGIGSGSGDAYVYLSTSQVKDLSNPSDSNTADLIDVLLNPIVTGIANSKVDFAANELVQNATYVITEVGDTDFTALGASANTVGEIFVHNGVVGSGSGTAEISEILPNLTSYAYDTSSKNAKTEIDLEISAIQTSVIDFININANLYEVLMPGNRSMLSNDFTQINDMGYGIIVTNGGLSECVSMFTYYCYTSYYSLNGGQIRSVGGSSAHGVYALAAEGSDPLEVPTPVDLYYNLSQGATIYNSAPYDNASGGLILYVSNYEYPPRDNSELEVDHGGSLGLVRYPIVTATTEDGFPEISGRAIYRLNLSADTDGLLASIPDGTDVTLRVNTELVLTGDVVDVATRPSTALKLNETFNTTLYRILEFSSYTVPAEELVPITFTLGEETTVNSVVPHDQLPGYIVKFSVSEGGSLPTGISKDEQYYVIDDGFTEFSFKISRTKAGVPIETTPATGSGSFFFEAAALAATILKEGYDYVEIQTWSQQPFVDYGDSLLITAGNFEVGVVYTIVTTGSTDFTLIGAASNAPGTIFTATGAGTGSGNAVVGGCTFIDTQTDGSFIAGHVYTIIDDGGGSSDYVTDHGAADNNPGTTFTATGAGSGGSGTADGNIVVLTNHGFQIGDVVRFESYGALPGNLSATRHYIVTTITANSFQVSIFPGGAPVNFADVGTGVNAVARVIGRPGDSAFAIVGPGENDIPRMLGATFNFKGNNYVVEALDNTDVTGEQYWFMYLDRPLEDSVVRFETPARLLLSVRKRTEGSQGTLTIRISLTRCTTHDFLEIGTGSYADTNYPNEIYGPPVRTATDSLLDTTGNAEYAQVVERGEGRCFFVTTDQFGNFNVGPFFKVDQGTGTVTFSASIALSNLSGIGFKRGVAIAEFSTDSSFSDNATDTVPVENAIRTYIDRRLGVVHSVIGAGETVDTARTIPVNVGGFMALTGQLPMNGDMNLGANKIINLADPVNDTDAVNLRSVKLSSLADFDFSVVQASSIMTFTGAGTAAVAARVVGDVQFDIDSTANTLDAQIQPEVIVNADINVNAAIAQSKLALNLLTSRAAAPTGTTADKRAASGIGSIDSSQFNVTDGWISIKNNGIALGKLAQIATDTVLGRSAAGTGDISAVSFSVIIDEGGAVKKNQYGSTGFLRRTSSLSGSGDADYSVIDYADLYSHNASFVDSNANSKIVVRTSGGDFGGRDIYAARSYYIGTNAPANKLMANTSRTATGGSINFYSYLGNAALVIGDGSSASDKATTYVNDAHRFRNRADSAFISITTAGINVGTNGVITTGSATDAGTITGDWSLTSSSTLEYGSGTLIANQVKVSATTSSDTTTYPLLVGANSATDQEPFTDSGLSYNASTNTLTATTFSGNLSGAASSINGQANSATITAATAATANTIVLRDASGDSTVRYSFASYQNSSDDVNTGSITYIMAKFGDNYHRSATAAKVAAFISGQTMNISGTSTNITDYTVNQSVGTGNNVQFAGVGVGTAGATNDIRAIGSITAGYSDSRLKANVRPIENALDKVSQITGVTYEPNDLALELGLKNTGREAGVISGDVKKVLPEVIKKAPVDIKLDDDGNEISKTGLDLETVDYERLVPLLIEAIKELKAEIEELKSNK